MQASKKGTWPLFWDFPAISGEARTQFVEAARNERPITLKFMKEEDIDLAKDRIEIAHLYQEGIAIHQGGIIIDDQYRTTVAGLYAAGDDAAMLGARGNSALGAMILGHRAGRFAAEHARQTNHTQFVRDQVKQETQSVIAPSRRQKGIEPLSLEERVREVVSTYCGIEKSGERIQKGLDLLENIRDAYQNGVRTRNPHQLMRYVELGHIINNAEMHLKASLMRTESRLGLSHRRVDYPDRDDQHWRKMIVIQRLDEDNMRLETRSLPWD